MQRKPMLRLSTLSSGKMLNVLLRQFAPARDDTAGIAAVQITKCGSPGQLVKHGGQIFIAGVGDGFGFFNVITLTRRIFVHASGVTA